MHLHHPEKFGYLNIEDFHPYWIETRDHLRVKIVDFIFNEKNFYLEYLVVKNPLKGKEKNVLLPMRHVYKVKPSEKIVEVNINSSEVSQFEPIGAHPHKSYLYYKLQNLQFILGQYRKAIFMSEMTSIYGFPWSFYFGDKDRKSVLQEQKNLNKLFHASFLRSGNEIRHYSLRCLDYEFGHIHSYIIDPNTFEIKFFVLDTRKFLPSRSVLIRPEAITTISDHNKVVQIPYRKKFIVSAPNFEGRIDRQKIEEVDLYFKDRVLKSA